VFDIAFCFFISIQFQNRILCLRGKIIIKCLWCCVDILAEVSRREKEENIIPNPDIDVYMKVR
jgi:hypothetical protein